MSRNTKIRATKPDSKPTKNSGKLAANFHFKGGVHTQVSQDFWENDFAVSNQNLISLGGAGRGVVFGGVSSKGSSRGAHVGLYTSPSLRQVPPGHLHDLKVQPKATSQD